MSANTAEEVKSHLKVYWIVFGTLACLTLATVGAAELHIKPHVIAIALGLAIACTKGSLVALHFMHLNSEKRTFWLYGTLALSAFFFFFCLLVPVITDHSSVAEKYTVTSPEAAKVGVHGAHDGAMHEEAGHGEGMHEETAPAGEMQQEAAPAGETHEEEGAAH